MRSGLQLEHLAVQVQLRLLLLCRLGQVVTRFIALISCCRLGQQIVIDVNIIGTCPIPNTLLIFQRTAALVIRSWLLSQLAENLRSELFLK